VKILLIDDDDLLSAALARVLKANRYAIDMAHDGQAGFDLATEMDYDLILLDVQLPKLDGIQLCRTLRSQGYTNPILLMTANDSDADVVAGFDAGADDYLSKPFTPEVLLARMRTLLRRSTARTTSSDAKYSTTTLNWQKLCLNPDSGRVTVGERDISLTATEYNLLELFLRHPNRIFNRSAILDKLWGFEDAPTDRAIVTHIKDLRKKLKAGGLTEDLIETIYGMGYRLKPAPQSQNTNATSTDTAHKINRVLERFRDTFNQQVETLEQAKAALLAGNLATELRQAAQREAHKLAGSLATFGYPDGSKLARSLEHLFINTEPLTSTEISQCSAFVTALQQTLAKSPVTQTIASSSKTPKYRVLVIDDDIALTERLKAESGGLGMRMQVVSTLSEARSRLTGASPDVVLLDLSFPDTEEDGLSLLQEITARLPNLPVIVFTGRDSLVDRLAVSRSGARQFLRKPATPEQIFRAINHVVSIPQTADAKVLIVDDDLAMLALLSNMLTPWGLDVVTLSQPQQFWDVLTATSPNLVLLDLEMPGVSGLELCQVVRQDIQWGDLPILVVTAHTDADSLEQAFAIGADDFITKPVLGPELVTRILSRIERTRLRPNFRTDISTQR
jgi:DNA-binding response OmpR family regulator